MLSVAGVRIPKLARLHLYLLRPTTLDRLSRPLRTTSLPKECCPGDGVLFCDPATNTVWAVAYLWSLLEKGQTRFVVQQAQLLASRMYVPVQQNTPVKAGSRVRAKALPLSTLKQLPAAQSKTLVTRIRDADAINRKVIQNWVSGMKQRCEMNLAISIRQPFAEMILRGEKVFEFRSRPTNIRGRVYIYASASPRLRGEAKVIDRMWDKIRDPDKLPYGRIVGRVDIVDCVAQRDGFGFKLRNPQRLARPWVPKNHPQPVWFRPR